ncbi:DUF2189 domain-containing protein [Mesorhizobium loti]|uniref:DUF2189 domain-containing protein n=1 Tax=Mesorhizobium loti R88b TaxID=935548 RepID=A0A6M7WSR1_RHILI|nr:DUF2189 domain-containing protein [Mesorhizobium loti]QKD05272.1 DUF2189 domain-containing protein [Mesorhizobium loti R88b]
MAEFHVISGAQITSRPLVIRKLRMTDINSALRMGLQDFVEKPSHYVFLCLIYPIVGVILITWTSGGNTLQLIYPLMSGFALLGPLAAIGLYEISRRREQRLDTSWFHAFEVLKSPAIPAMLGVGALLLALFVAWIFTAQALFDWLYGPTLPTSITAFAHEVLTTRTGWTLIILGNLAGLVFALIVLTTTVVAFPLLLDRDVGAYRAIVTSAQVMAKNPVPILSWGLIVAVLLLLGSLPLLVGLAVVIPVLGHSTWHLYRRAVV